MGLLFALWFGFVVWGVALRLLFVVLVGGGVTRFYSFVTFRYVVVVLAVRLLPFVFVLRFGLVNNVVLALLLYSVGCGCAWCLICLVTYAWCFSSCF